MKLVYKDDEYVSPLDSALFLFKKNGILIRSISCNNVDGNGIKICLNRLAEQYLNPKPLQGSPDGFVTGYTSNPDAVGEFALENAITNELVKKEKYLFGWDGVVESNNAVLSKPINGHMDPRMYFMLSAIME